MTEQQRAWLERHPDYMRNYYRDHKERWQDYGQRARDRGRLRPCRVEGCPDPRYVSPAGYVDARCRRHGAEHSRERYWTKRGQSPPSGRPPRPCLLDDCPNLRWIRPDGVLGDACPDHSADLVMLQHRLAGTGLSLEHFGELILAQDRCCAACGKRRPNAFLTWQYDRERDTLMCIPCRQLIEGLRRSPAAAIVAYLRGDSP